MAAAVLLLAACSDDDADDVLTGTSTSSAAPPVAEADTEGADEETAATEPPAPPPPVQQLEGLRIAATPVVDTQMLTAMAWRDGDPDPYLADQHGMIYHLVGGRADPVLDLTPHVLDYEQGAEYGMLGMTFDPVDGRLIVGFNSTDVDTRILSYAVGGDGRPDPASEREILRVEQPGVGHNSGTLAFDADDNLLIAMGDGGGSRGADAQDMTKLLGGLLRITPDRTGPGYTVPDDNPFVGEAGVAPEIWAKGMRNPWRFSIDHATGDVWIGDVGESSWEAIYRIPAGTAGANLGWPAFEGSHPSDFNREVAAPADPLMPVHEYSHDVGPAVIGGHVYRGDAIPQLEGAYVFMDMTGPVWAMGADGVVQLDVQPGGVQTSFAESPDGELYVLTMRNGLFRLGPS
ncbi:MAG TPA: PQQ-dependent sugar dehydrogenase [Acidimicrobiales bacterium]|nr:PQQ-dependent sugar dehydrogenase [Acidimicrobiales bacterium]